MSLFNPTLIACALVALIQDAEAIERLGRGELAVNAAAGFEYDSNIFSGAVKSGDVVGRITAGLQFEQKDHSLLNLRSGVTAEVVRYHKHFDLKSENVGSQFELSYPNGVERNAYSEMDGHWNNVTQARSDAGSLLTFQQRGLGGAYRLYVNERSGFRIHTSYDQEVFKDATLSDSDDLIANFDYLYRYSSKLNLLGGISYHSIDYTGSYNTQQSGRTIRIGGDGVLRPKLHGRLSVGAQYGDFRSPSQKQQDIRPFYEVAMHWTATAKTRLTLTGLADFRSTPLGEINNRRDIEVELATALTRRGSAVMSLGVAQEKFEGAFRRTDESASLGLQYQHSIFDASTLGFRARYEVHTSTMARFETNRVVVAVNYRVEY